MPRRRTARLPVVAVPLVLLVLLVGCSAGIDPEPSGALPTEVAERLPAVADGVSQAGVPQLINLTVMGGRTTGVDSVVPVHLNVAVRLTVLADTADVLLVRGYDIRVRLAIDAPVQLSFLAHQAGSFDVVLENSGQVLTRLQVD